MLNISFIFKNNDRQPDATVMSELAIYKDGKLVVIFCFITCKVLTTE